MSTTYVYIVGQKDSPKFISPIKVGVAGDPEKRLLQLRTGCPFPIGLVFCLALPERRQAFDVEVRFRKMKLSVHLHGEWFDMDPYHATWVMISNLSNYWEERGYGHSDIAKLINKNIDFCERYNEALYA